MKKGKLFVIDGTDGSGKQTQLEKLRKRLDEENIEYKNVSFPNYESPSSSLVKMYLSGEFAFDLGTELLFNYNLHPAIISACRNLDELDIYLDYLENNETENFKCFSIIFEIPPVVS